MSLHVIDDHPVMREAIVLMLRRLRPGAVIREYDRIGAFESASAGAPAPELICLDLKLPDAEGTQGVERVRRRWPSAPIVVISASPADEMEAAAMQAGATRYLDKNQSARLMAATVRELLGADTDGTGEVASSADPMLPDDRPFSKRQVELLVMIDRGETNRDIADKLGISEHTVKVHLWRLFRRMGVSSRTQATRQARDMGLL